LFVPKAVVGIIIAALCCYLNASRAQRGPANQLQTSLNLALGSVLAAIGLTIPAVAFVSIVIGQPWNLVWTPRARVLLVLTLFISVITLGTGRTTVLQGIVRLIIFAAFLFFAVVP
jgi:Ca2+:H+ antiporter